MENKVSISELQVGDKIRLSGMMFGRYEGRGKMFVEWEKDGEGGGEVTHRTIDLRKQGYEQYLYRWDGR